MTLGLSRKHLTEACERADIWGYQLLDAHPGREGAGPGLTLPAGRLDSFLEALVLTLIEGGHGADAGEVSRRVCVEPKRSALVAYWPGAGLAD
ncbi:hypothetical protein [Streptomyces cavernae]|uniref:hypothetical protein n=1 Tax=Streptomyces cavernae TaxID=2259034 RepID=UPI000FEB6078|nr:hypothetical protein [Streptomyces cavernae]